MPLLPYIAKINATDKPLSKATDITLMKEKMALSLHAIKFRIYIFSGNLSSYVNNYNQKLKY